jgi:hypothetical protein
MLVADFFAALTTLYVLFKLQTSNDLEVWDIHLSSLLRFFSNNLLFRRPQCNLQFFSVACISSNNFATCTEKKTRARQWHLGGSLPFIGLTFEVGDGLLQLACPAITGVLMSFIGIHGIIILDFAFFIFAGRVNNKTNVHRNSELVLIFGIEVPPVKESEEGKKLKEVIHYFFRSICPLLCLICIIQKGNRESIILGGPATRYLDVEGVTEKPVLNFLFQLPIPRTRFHKFSLF